MQAKFVALDCVNAGTVEIIYEHIHCTARTVLPTLYCAPAIDSPLTAAAISENCPLTLHTFLTHHLEQILHHRLSELAAACHSSKCRLSLRLPCALRRELGDMLPIPSGRAELSLPAQPLPDNSKPSNSDDTTPPQEILSSLRDLRLSSY